MTVPAMVALLLLANRSIMETELLSTRSALDLCAANLDSCNEPGPTVTVTATIFTAPPPTQNKWWFTTESLASTDELTSPTSLSTSLTPPPSSTLVPTLIPTIPVQTIPTPAPAPAPTSTPTITENFALSAIRDLPFLWPLRFEFPAVLDDMDIPEKARTTVAYAIRGLGLAWQVFRKVLHYPLDPP